MPDRHLSKDWVSDQCFVTCPAGTTISMFLFGNAYEEHYRESEGSVVAIFNAKADTDNKGEVALKVFELDTILRLGTSADFAYCGSKTKV